MIRESFYITLIISSYFWYKGMCTITCTWFVFSLHFGEECAAYCILICQGYIVFKSLMEVKVLVIDLGGYLVVPIVALGLFDVLHINHRRQRNGCYPVDWHPWHPPLLPGTEGCRSRSKADPSWSMMASPWMWLWRRMYWPWLQTGHHPLRRPRTQVILIVGSEGPSGTTRPERDWWNPQSSL